jgi:aminoglycoside phosphotransferase family enzyme
MADDQSEIIAFLEEGRAFGRKAERIDTHAAMIFLAGDAAYKMKRAVAYSFNRRYDLDTITQRLAWTCAQTKPHPYRVIIAG